MAPIKSLPPPLPPVPSRPAPAPAATPPDRTAFEPGLAAPRPAPPAAPAAPGQQLYTLQALSTYAGLVIGADSTAPTGTASTARTQAPAGTPPAPPGGLVDITV